MNQTPCNKDEGTNDFLYTKEEEQIKRYKSGAEEGKTVNFTILAGMAVKNLIYPTAKFLYGSEYNCNQPNFATHRPKAQSVCIWYKLLNKLEKSVYTTHNKVLWWLARRKDIRRKIGRLRESDVWSVQEGFLKGNIV